MDKRGFLHIAMALMAEKAGRVILIVLAFGFLPVTAVVLHFGATYCSKCNNYVWKRERCCECRNRLYPLKQE